MYRKNVAKALILIGFTCFNAVQSYGMQAAPNVKSQEISEVDGVPVLIKHLPNWESVRDKALFTTRLSDLRKALGERNIFELVEFGPGIEAVTAPYAAGRLLIIEYPTPQVSVEADTKFVGRLSVTPQDPPILYRRVGNYSVFVFDISNETAAAALIDQVKYEKTVQWLGEDPTLLKRLERAFITTTSQIFFSTLLWILTGLGLSIVVGIISGFMFFRFREKQRSEFREFSDAGGMIRLNLDGLTPDILPEGLLGD
ncbi:MAG: hypothetical protein WBD22_01695 [Pyrinomonadaceae bacterium]